MDDVDSQELIPKMDESVLSCAMLSQHCAKLRLGSAEQLLFRDVQRKIEPPVSMDQVSNISSSLRTTTPILTEGVLAPSIDVPRYIPSNTSNWLSFPPANAVPSADREHVEAEEKLELEYSSAAMTCGEGGDSSQLCATPGHVPVESFTNMPVCAGRETHNEKERKRRYRIKNACSLLKDLIPGLTEKTDKATVLEYTVQYLIHLKRHIGRQFDGEFLQKYSPY